MASGKVGEVLAVPCLPAETPGLFDTLILLDPLPHTAEAEELLREGREKLTDDGIIVAGFRSGTTPGVLEAFRSDRPARLPNGIGLTGGVRRYSRTGIDVLLSRAGLDAVSVMPMQEADAREPKAWIVQARPCSKQVSPFGEARKARRLQASEANARGEGLYGEGDLVGALAAFAEAAKLWSEDAVYLNNLATVLDALGYTDEAWRRIREAFHLDSSLPAVRENLTVIAQKIGRADEADELLTIFAALAVKKEND